MKLNKKLISVAVIIPVALLLGIVVFNTYIANPQVKIHLGPIVHEYQNSDNSTYFNLEYSIPVMNKANRETLYNCKLEAKYLAINGTYLTATKDLGTQEFSHYTETLNLPLPDFKLDPDHFHSGALWPADTQNIEINAYGYKKP